MAAGGARWPPKRWPPKRVSCVRLGSVSGRYEGAETAVARPSHAELDLRVDIDTRSANSPVTNRVSGDFHQRSRFAFPGGRTVTWRVYQESWIIDQPTVAWARCEVVITGSVRFYAGGHPATEARIRIPWANFQQAGPADVTFTASGATTVRFSCARRSDCFRDLALEIDVCESVNTEPVVPGYDTHAHDTRPAVLPARTLDIGAAYRDAGICVAISPERTVIDDSAAQFAAWTDAELHDAMEQHFSRYPGTWPKWEMWGLLAGSYTNSGTAGIMFDYGTVYGGPGRAPERQGFAVFREHWWFDELVAEPVSQSQAAAMRQFLYTWVHEAGHTFNFLHSWDKSRPDALSWMNYDWRYDNRNGPDSFWNNFLMRFDDEELIHLRHGDRSEVIPGADPWATGWHFEAPPGVMAQAEGEAPIEVLLRSRPRFDFLEPVEVEVRIRNLLEGLPLPIDARLHPDDGVVTVFIRRPDRTVTTFAPITCKLGQPEIQTLAPANEREGEERYSATLDLTFGGHGFSFDQPGEYLVRAIYTGLGEVQVLSNVHRLFVGHPVSPETEDLAARFFTYEVGMQLYLHGSTSPFLSEGLGVLEEVADRERDTVVGAKAATVAADAEGTPFFRIDEATNTLTQTHEPRPERALELTEGALAVYRQVTEPTLNIDYHELVRRRARLLATVGRQDDGRQELRSLSDDLAARGVNPPVLEDIERFGQTL